MTILNMLNLALDSIKTDSEGWSYASYQGYHFTSVFQPLFDKNMAIFAYEGLVRIKDSTEKPISPDAFFSQLSQKENHQLEDMVVHLCVHLHIENFSKLASHAKNKMLFFNCPPESFVRRDFSEEEISGRASADITELGLSPDNLVCELQEFSSANIKKAHLGIFELKKAGIRIALDDYGDGECDLDRVKLISPDVVKIDMKYVQNFYNFRPEIAEIVDHCKKHQIKVIAEGVETEEQLNHFKTLGVDGFQGYLLSTPKRPQELTE